MPIIPQQKTLSLWLFPDNLIENYEYKFLGYEPKYNTKSNKEIPVFLFYGKIKGTKGEFEGELLTTIWNIKNLEKLKEQLGEDTDKWPEDLFFKITSKDEKFELVVVEKV